jgi:mercuric ion binding protein
MKQFLKCILFICVIVASASCRNKSTTTEASKIPLNPVIATSQFKIWGNCEKCKETIEGSLKVDGIAKADWNADTKLMRVTYDENKISLDQIQKNIAAVGYDNSKYKGDDKAYASLPDCCQYERK